MPYDVYAYGDRVNGIYPFLIITDRHGDYGAGSSFGVILEQPTPEYNPDTYEFVYNLNMLFNGRKTTVKAYESAGVYGDRDYPGDIRTGDVIVYTTDRYGYADRIDILMSADESGIYGGYSDVLYQGPGYTYINIPENAYNRTSSWWAETDEDYINHYCPVSRLIYGPIIEKNASSIKLGSLKQADFEEFYDASGEPFAYDGFFTYKYLQGEGGSMDISITPDTNIYILDYSVVNPRVRLKAGSLDEITASVIPDSLLYNDGDAILWSADEEPDSGINFAFAKVVDKEATDMFVILAPENQYR